MHPPQFDYHRAETVAEARSLLEAHADRDPRLLAGGHSLVPEMKTGRTAPGVVVDIGGVDSLEGVTFEDDETIIGALTTYAALLEEPTLGERHPVLADALGEIGDPQVRNRGTVGGNLAQAEPAADLPAAVLAARATVVAVGDDGDREIRAREFFRGKRETALERDEILARVRLPRADRGESAYVRKTHPASGWASVGAAAALECEDGRVRSARVAATGVADRALRLESVEDALAGEPVDGSSLRAVAARATDDVAPEDARSDLHASGEYRRAILPTYVERALETAVDRALGRTGGDTA